ncbi:NUMOD4 domain-containing protein [Psychrobacillus sp. FSL H8-0510]|uniref:NUMOD4 domain-containing protein n=1 Tax=Psychrobacillus sp. FSL H8-0510 TaxID=2921394 RepID=UPI0030F505DF
MEGELSKTIEGYEGLYEITESGRIYSIRHKRFMVRCENEYGFHIVKLSKNGKGTNHRVFDLWRKAFEDLTENKFKGAKKRIY